jgi:signal transduction histidine kinase
LSQVERIGYPEEMYPGRRAMAVLRTGLALACLAVQLFSPVPSHWGVTAAAVVFSAFSVAALVFRRKGPAGSSLLYLIGETIFFLVFAAYGADSSGWLSSALYFHLLLSALYYHHWWDTWGIVAVSTGFLAVAGGDRAAVMWRVVPWPGLLVSVVALHKSNLDRKLAEYMRQVREHRELAVKARDAERHQLAGDFHDGPLQGFISLQMRLTVLKKLIERDPSAVKRELDELQELCHSQVAEMRAFLRGIRPVEVSEAGLAASLRHIVAEFQKDSGITVTFQSSGSPELSSPEACLEVVQIVREALHNVQKHSRATRVAVTVSRSRDCLEISIEDNGIGFPFSGAYKLDELELLHIGPFSIQRRVRTLGGELAIESHPQRGSGIAVRLPV